MTRRRHAHCRDRTHAADRGRVSVLFAALTVGVLVIVGLGLDAGLALSGKTRAYQLAADAARVGVSQGLDVAHYRATGEARLAPAQATAAAQTRLDQAGADEVTVTATAEEVTVTVWHEEGTQLLGMIGIDTITVSATATATAQHGITSPDDLPGSVP
ncbi:MAG: TadE/TadG family type IV pilus assembly protein [Natronosporangium sp.]